MADIFQITMLPAKEGDCLVITYGDDDNRNHLIIDSGRSWTYSNALKQYLDEYDIREPELLVITHVDRDHIDGILPLVKDELLSMIPGEVWFNTRGHLDGDKIINPNVNDPVEAFGAKMGEALSSEVIRRNWPWNRLFGGGPVECADDFEDNIFQIGNLRLTLLSPDRKKLEALIPDWDKECSEAGIIPGGAVKDYVVRDDDVEAFGGIDIDALAEEKFEGDTTTANGSSIAFILEYKHRKILLAGDAHTDLLIDSLKKARASELNLIELDAFKIPHHGSKHNLSKELLSLIKCNHYLISTNGNYFKHPDKVAMARLIKYGTPGSTINFNYKTEYTEIWNNPSWQEKYKYRTNYPVPDNDGYLSLNFNILD